jgi:hypothetical protein
MLIYLLNTNEIDYFIITSILLLCIMQNAHAQNIFGVALDLKILGYDMTLLNKVTFKEIHLFFTNSVLNLI